jgi:hypothetical protein
VCTNFWSGSGLISIRVSRHHELHSVAMAVEEMTLSAVDKW